MSDGDLLFRYPARTHGNLVFGADDGGEIPTSQIVGAAALTRPTWGGVVERIEALVASAVLVRPAAWAGAVVYVSDTQRPLVGHVASGFQDGRELEAGASTASQDARRMVAGGSMHQQRAKAIDSAVTERARDARRAGFPIYVRMQDGDAGARSTRAPSPMHGVIGPAVRFRCKTGDRCAWAAACACETACMCLRPAVTCCSRTAGPYRSAFKGACGAGGPWCWVASARAFRMLCRLGRASTRRRTLSPKTRATCRTVILCSPRRGWRTATSFLFVSGTTDRSLAKPSLCLSEGFTP